MTTNRMSLIVALSVIAGLAVLTMSMLIPARHVLSSSAYDQIELIRAGRYAAAAAQQAYLDQRRGEWTAGKVYDARQAYLDFRHGEWTTGTNPALADLQ